mmetsp:Transcript_1907/g.5765  ORF Transcript_1907/g.5765 Transcript_1907/m.5765 type:complete len:257 (+) Transcript_1907:600-1370(+)
MSAASPSTNRWTSWWRPSRRRGAAGAPNARRSTSPARASSSRSCTLRRTGWGLRRWSTLVRCRTAACRACCARRTPMPRQRTTRRTADPSSRRCAAACPSSPWHRATCMSTTARVGCSARERLSSQSTSPWWQTTRHFAGGSPPTRRRTTARLTGRATLRGRCFARCWTRRRRRCEGRGYAERGIPSGLAGCASPSSSTTRAGLPLPSPSPALPLCTPLGSASAAARRPLHPRRRHRRNPPTKPTDISQTREIRVF